MKFSREPIIWVGWAIAILMAITDYLNGNLGLQTLDAVLVATGAVIGRQLVVPVAKVRSGVKPQTYPINKDE